MYVMMTVPRKYIKNGRKWLEYFNANDCHKWVIALEHGKGGLEHWQVRFKVRGCDTKEGKQQFMNWWKLNCPQAHIEFTENWCDYERKEGTFVCSDDKQEVLKVRFGVLRPEQRHILHEIRSASDREIDVYLDKRGCKGKTWLSLHLFERGEALIIPRYCGTAREISNFICSAYSGQSIIIVDIPRASKIKPELYEALEEIKDGLVSDPRYSGKSRNIRGIQLVVFTNSPLDEKRLSRDRWRLHGVMSPGELSP